VKLKRLYALKTLSFSNALEVGVIDIRLVEIPHKHTTAAGVTRMTHPEMGGCYVPYQTMTQ
jgi:hypothetical protein